MEMVEKHQDFKNLCLYLVNCATKFIYNFNYKNRKIGESKYEKNKYNMYTNNKHVFDN